MDRTVGPRYPPGSWPACSLTLRCRPGAPRPGSRVLERHGPSTPIPIGPPGACRPRADPPPCDTQRENVWKTFRFTNRTARLSLIWGVLVPVTVFSICQRQDVRRFHTARGSLAGSQLTLWLSDCSSSGTSSPRSATRPSPGSASSRRPSRRGRHPWPTSRACNSGSGRDFLIATCVGERRAWALGTRPRRARQGRRDGADSGSRELRTDADSRGSILGSLLTFQRRPGPNESACGAGGGSRRVAPASHSKRHSLKAKAGEGTNGDRVQHEAGNTNGEAQGIDFKTWARSCLLGVGD